MGALLLDDPATVTGRVKWYDSGKGYGFLVPDGGGGDILIHASCVRNAGRTGLDEGDVLTVSVTRGQRGLQAVELLEITSTRSDRTSERPTEIVQGVEAEGEFMPARVKWFNKQKGFGFLNVFGNSEDVFIHMETLRQFGFADLQPGEAICVRLVRGPRGHMAGELCRWEDVILSVD